MNRQQFMSRLERSLKSLNREEREEILRDFGEHFEIGMEQGKSEEEIIASLGNPNQIAKELLAVHYIEKAESKSSIGNLVKAAYAAVGLGFFNLLIVLGPSIALAALVFSGWVVGGKFVISPILSLIDLIQFGDHYGVFLLFASLFLSGVGLFILIGMTVVTRWVMKGFARYLSYNVRIVKGGLKHDDDH